MTWPIFRRSCLSGSDLAVVLSRGVVGGVDSWLKGVMKFVAVGVGRFGRFSFAPEADCKTKFISRKIPGSAGRESVSDPMLVFN